MARKRKNPQSAAPAAQTESLSKFGLDETFDDSEDEFFAGRDKVLLDEIPAAKRRRRLQEQEQDLQPSDEEVFRDEELQSSDEEMLDDEDGINEDDIDESEKSEQDQNNDEDNADESDENWGTSRADYYNADIIETEADALEEETEARRLRQKQLKGMTEADFGFDEKQWTAQEEPTRRGPMVEKLPDVQIPEDATPEERMKLLNTRYPEFQPLANEYVKLRATYDRMGRKVKKVQLKQAKNQSSSGKTSKLSTKYHALSAYLGVLAMYLAIFTSSKSGLAISPSEIREHPIMNTILRCRQAWEKVKNWSEDDKVEENSSRPSKIDIPVSKSGLVNEKDNKLKKKKSNGILKAVPNGSEKKSNKIQIEKETTPPSSPESINHDEQSVTIPKPKRIALEDLLANTAKIDPEDDMSSDLGDEAPLTTSQALEKAKKKKSLRFYTSQLAQKSNRRGLASRETGGDDDVPYKESIHDKQIRLNKEAEQRGKSNHFISHADLDRIDQSYNNGDNVDDNTNNDDGDENEYYNSLLKKSKLKKAEQKLKSLKTNQRNLGIPYDDGEGGDGRAGEDEYGWNEDGKRGINYQIEKNRGLTPRRKKEVRNPRVKKRMKYDQKVKKLGTIRPIYKGGEGRGGYGGELSGIKSNLVKSVKL